MKISIKKLKDNAIIPQYQTPGSAGFDLHACFEDEQGVRKLLHGQTLIPTGLSIALPEGFEAQIRPRSGLALKNGVTVLNSPGTIDSDYRGEIKVLLINHGDEPFTIKRGDRIAQMVIAPVVRAEFDQVEELPETTRGKDGFGSTGA